MIPTLFLVTIIIFTAVRFIPGNVIEIMVSEMAGDSDVAGVAELTAESLRKALGFDVPIHIQYLRWLGVIPNVDGTFSGLVEGNLGRSLWTDRSVAEEIIKRVPVTVELAVLAVTIAVLFALPIGTFSAIRQDTWGDYGGRTIAILAISLPSFWLGTLVIVYPSVWWGWSPSMEYIPIVEDVLGNLQLFIIPGLITGLVFSGTTMRMTRTMMLEVLRQDYIRTAWAKGLTERTIIIRHAMKNALIPVITIIGLMFPILIAGTVVIEQIFNLPGIGRLLLDAITKRDYPIISGINIMAATFILSVNLLVDLTYGWLDPRVHFR
jgi:peptide/nickel transport system permease protein